MVSNLLVSPHQCHHCYITIFFILILASTTYCEDDKDYTECGKTFDCGRFKSLSYPFWSGTRPPVCGHPDFELKSCEDGDRGPIIARDTLQFSVLSIEQSSRVMTLKLVNFEDYICPVESLRNSTERDSYLFGNYDPPNVQKLNLLYNCTASDATLQAVQTRISCTGYGEGRVSFYGDDNILMNSGLDPSQCSMRIKVPIPTKVFGELVPGMSPPDLERVVGQEFNVSYDDQGTSICRGCMDSNGSCGTNMTDPKREFVCLCRDQPSNLVCPPNDNAFSTGRKLRIGVASGVTVIVIICIILCFKKAASSIIPTIFSKKKAMDNQDLEAFLRNHGPLAAKKYSFSDVKRMTELFKEKLGQGGYGVVYKGTLKDGRLVAVKVLNASEGVGKEFMNEVASISRTSHVNIVTLLGFCLEGGKKVLIYDFMPNGSLEKFLNNENVLPASQQLGWEKLYEIAVGVARGLEYLHHGCNTRIVHFDIKPHNILLDADFCPKVSDFGLAKPCTRKESIMSTMEARGTIGYIAPEVFSRNFGKVSHKSDVYSYGMMVLEMVGGRKNHEAEAGPSSENYFPQWIYKRLELGTEFELDGVTAIEEAAIVRKTTIVGLWCIQTNPSDRPTISKVIEMLEGPTEALNIPPKPFLSSPPRLLSYSSTVSST